MIDLKFLRENPDLVRDSQRTRGANPILVDQLIAADESRRAAIKAADEPKAEQNAFGKKIGQAAPEDRPALLAGGAGYVLASAGFFGLSHISATAALQSAVACVAVGFVAGVLMAAGNRVLWTHRWVPGGRAAVASALVPILSVGVPVYAIARLLGGFLAG